MNADEYFKLLGKSGRSVNRKFDFRKHLEPEAANQDIPKAVAWIFEQFGGLKIKCCKTGLECRPKNVEFDPNNLYWTYFANGDAFFDKPPNAKAPDESLFLVGRLREYNTPIMVNRNGVAYIDGDMDYTSGCFAYEKGIHAMLEHLLFGYKLTGNLWTY